MRPPVSMLFKISPSPVTALYKPPTPAPIKAPPPIVAATPVSPTAVPTEAATATNAILFSSL